jgi:predicted DNA-binding protein
MTSLRLPADVEQKISSFAKARNLSKSAVILAALEKFFEQEEEVDSFELGKDYFGRFGSDSGKAACAPTPVGAQADELQAADSASDEYIASGTGRLSADYKKLMKGRILVKYRSR